MLFPYKSRLRSWWNTTQFPVATSDSLSSAQPWSSKQNLIAWAVLITASLGVLLPNLSYPLIEPDETRYAQIAIEMNASQDWITPTLDGEPYLDKPPLMYWLTAVSFKLFGTQETAARLPSMLAALFTIVITFALGSRVVSKRAAWLGALLLVLCGGFVLAGRFLILDGLLTLFTTLCLFSGYIAVREQQHRWAWWMLSGVACAMGVLTKGPIALVLCAPPLVINGWLRADQTRTRLLHWGAFVIPMILVCVPWYIAVIKFNPEFIDYFFWEHNLKRFTEGMNHQQPFLFYVPIVFVCMFPASLLLPSAILFLASRADRKRQLRSKDLGFLLCGSAWILLFFSLASCKLPTYILPAIPLISLIMGVMVDRTVLRCESAGGVTTHLKPFPRRALLILTCSLLLVVGAEVWLSGLSAVTVTAAVVCLVTTGFILRFWNRPIAFSVNAWAATVCAAVALLAFSSIQLLPSIATARSLYSKTSRVADEFPEALVVFYREKPHGVQLQIDSRRVVYFPTDFRDDFVRFLTSQPDAIVVTADECIDSTREALSPTHDLVNLFHHDHLYFAKRNKLMTTSPSLAVASPAVVPPTVVPPTVVPPTVATVEAEERR